MSHGSLLRTKSVEQSIRDTQDPEHKLKKELGALDLMVFGVGVIIGAGIFILTGQAAARYAGPRCRTLVRAGRRDLRLSCPLLR
jgi:APA family basic amino acid/polyamine antiporter